MKGDFTRSTFKRNKHYSGVRMQQGRVQLDADWNEQVDIANYRTETETRDMAGASAAPKDNAGFEITTDGENFWIGYGRIYVDGILCENEPNDEYPNGLPLSLQPHFGEATPPVQPSGGCLVYLDVWQRPVTALEDPTLHEVALDKADTTIRSQTIWQVKFRPIDLRDVRQGCVITFDNNELAERLPARLAAQAVPLAPTPENPCPSSSQTPFRGIANQLHRVEIHTAGVTGTATSDQTDTATFKWSKDNGSIVSRIAQINNNTNTIVLEQPTHDDRQAFQPGNWVEVIDELRELKDGRGIMVRLTNWTEGIYLVFDPTSASEPLPTITSNSLAENWKVRRWDHVTDSIKKPAILTSDQWIPLEDGIEVQFAAGDKYEAGDYWLIPARTSTGDIEWPTVKDPADSTNRIPVALDRLGIVHHYGRLAIINLKYEDGKWEFLHDCRKIFSPLAEQTNVFYLSGDGQEAFPGRLLPRPLQVGVANGQRRVSRERIKFELVPPRDPKEQPRGGLFRELPTDPKNPGTGEVHVTVETGTEEDPDLHGIAQCYWKLDADKSQTSQQVKATLLDALDRPLHLPIRFNANQSRASQVAYYTVPDCGNETNPTVQTLFKKLLKEKWPDLDQSDTQDNLATVDDVLDTLLCYLNADTLPFLFDTCTNNLYPNQEKTIGEALRALCTLMANHVGYDDEDVPADCKKAAPTVRTLLQDALSSRWPDYDQDGRPTVKDVLNTLLCYLSADTLPFHFNTCANNLYPNQEKTIGEALRALCTLMANHVGYDDDDVPADCKNNTPTVRTLLKEALGPGGWPDYDKDGRPTVKDVLNTLLCKLDAPKVPYQKPRDIRHYPDDPELLPADVAPTVGAVLDFLSLHFVPPGAIMAFASTLVPKGWLECNGQAISRLEYAALFAVLEETYGPGNGLNTFQVPDLRGEFIRGWDGGSLGTQGTDPGRTFGSFQLDQIQSHTHKEEVAHTHNLGNVLVTGTTLGTQTGIAHFAASEAGLATDPTAVELFDPVASSQGPVKHGPETRPRNIALMYCIKF